MIHESPNHLCVWEQKKNKTQNGPRLSYHSMEQLEREGAALFLRHYFSIKITLRSPCVKNGIAFGVGIPEHFMAIPAPSQYSSVPSWGPWWTVYVQWCWAKMPTAASCPAAGGATLSVLLLDSTVWVLPNMSWTMSSALAHTPFK